MKDPGYQREYDALEAEFAVATALICARADAGPTQEELAEPVPSWETDKISLRVIWQ
jgi:hypothetical protein